MARKRNNSAKRSRPGEARQNAHSAGDKLRAKMSEDDLYSAIEVDREILILVLDEVQDPHNLGACLRSADGAGVAAVVVPRHKSSPVTETVVRIACGAAAHVPVVPVGNMARFLKKIREDYAVKVVGTADQSDCDLFDCDLATGALAVVLGAEGKGMRRLTMENCDELIRIPMYGEVECLNVSNATAVCLYEALRQRRDS